VALRVGVGLKLAHVVTVVDSEALTVIVGEEDPLAMLAEGEDVPQRDKVGERLGVCDGLVERDLLPLPDLDAQAVPVLEKEGEDESVELPEEETVGHWEGVGVGVALRHRVPEEDAVEVRVSDVVTQGLLDLVMVAEVQEDGVTVGLEVGQGELVGLAQVVGVLDLHRVTEAECEAVVVEDAQSVPVPEALGQGEALLEGVVLPDLVGDRVGLTVLVGVLVEDLQREGVEVPLELPESLWLRVSEVDVVEDTEGEGVPVLVMEEVGHKEGERVPVEVGVEDLHCV
jgi:hypothetical protein